MGRIETWWGSMPVREFDYSTIIKEDTPPSPKRRRKVTIQQEKAKNEERGAGDQVQASLTPLETDGKQQAEEEHDVGACPDPDPGTNVDCNDHDCGEEKAAGTSGRGSGSGSVGGKKKSFTRAKNLLLILLIRCTLSSLFCTLLAPFMPCGIKIIFLLACNNDTNRQSQQHCANSCLGSAPWSYKGFVDAMSRDQARATSVRGCFAHLMIF